MITRLASLLLFIAALAHADWQPLAPLPAGNGGFACGFIDGKLIVAGGTNWADDTKHWLDVIWSYDPQINAWSTIGKLPQPCAYAASGVINGRLVIAGGSDGEKTNLGIVAVAAKGSVERLMTDIELPVFSSFAVHGDQLLLAGGATSPSDLSTFTTGHVAITFKEWPQVKVQHIKGSQKTGFGIATAAAALDQVFVFGGAEFDAQTQVRNRDTVFSIPGKSEPTKLPVPIRGITAVSLSDHHIYLAGGYPNDDTGFTDQSWIFLAVNGQLVPAKPLPIKSMVHLASDGEWVYCLGGEDKKKHRSDKVWRIRAQELLAPVIMK